MKLKVKKSTIPSGSLTENYLPADHSDVYACVTDTGKEIIPDDIMVNFWTDFPRWITALFKLHDFLVKLDAYLSVHVESRKEHKTISAITLVNFKNKLGRFYFFVIRPFHGMIVKSILKQSVKMRHGDYPKKKSSVKF